MNNYSFYVVEEKDRSRLVMKCGKRKRTLIIARDFQHLIEVKRALNQVNGTPIFTVETEQIITYPGQGFTMWYAKIGKKRVFATNVDEKCLNILIRKFLKKFNACRGIK
jgi:hypothetical protein